MLGKIISVYKLIEVIGTGGMSTVYLGRSIETGRLVAVKVCCAIVESAKKQIPVKIEL